VARLLVGAQAAFAAHGYGATTIHEICAQARVGIGTFYAHYSNKRELLQQVMVERALVLSRQLTADDLLDRARLVAKLSAAVDEPVAAGLWRAWHEAVLDEPEIARFHAAWRAASVRELAAIVTEARRRSVSRPRRVSASVVAWTMMTLARDFAIHERGGAPDVAELAQLIQGLVLGTLEVG
jgi:AcrR family transcriptional regulator